MGFIITIDVGTSSLRSIIYDFEGKPYFKSQREYTSIFGTNRQVEQDPLTWKNALFETLRDCGDYVNNNDLNIEALSVTSQRASVIPVTDNGTPLYNALMWQDKRSTEQCSHISSQISIRDIYLKTGLRLDPYFSVPKMMWLKEERPEVYKNAYKLIGVQDFIIYLLTNSFVTDWTQAARTMLLNIDTFKWDDELISITGVDREKLCELKEPGSKAGGLSNEASQITGLNPGIPVIMSGGDQQSAALALNVLRPGFAEANTGTGSFVIAYSEKPVFDSHCRTLCSAAAVPDKWIAEAGILTTGTIYRWLKEEFYKDAQMEQGFEALNMEADNVPIGANGVMVLPHFEGSAAPYWNPSAKGMFFNLSLGTKRGDIARAVLEGISLEIAENIGLIENLVGRVEMVSVAGGLTNLELFNQIQADAFDKMVIRYENNEASSLGALMSAGVTLGEYSDYEEAFRRITPVEPMRVPPVNENVIKYKNLMLRKKMLYDALNEREIYSIFKSAL